MRPRGFWTTWASDDASGKLYAASGKQTWLDQLAAFDLRLRRKVKAVQRQVESLELKAVRLLLVA